MMPFDTPIEGELNAHSGVGGKKFFDPRPLIQSFEKLEKCGKILTVDGELGFK